MIDGHYFVPDTNVMISRSLARNGVPAQALRAAMHKYQVLISDETFRELETVLLRRKFDHYSPLSERLDFLTYVDANAKRIEDVPPVSACRDPKDDKFSPSR